MNGWAVLDRSDPAPGDVTGTRGLGESLLRQASDIESQTARLRTLASDRGTLQLAGDYAAPYTQALEDLPGDLSKLGSAYHRCGTALTTFAQALNEAKTRAGNALRAGQDADLRYRAALRQLHLLLPAGINLSLGTSLNPMSIEAATAGLDADTRAQIQTAVRQAQNASHDLDRARSLADQAAALRDEAEDTCVTQINAALDQSGIRNKSWLQKEWQQFSANLNWDTFIRDCRKEALVMGMLALVFSGPVGWSFAAMALAAGALVFADGVRQYADGDIGLGELALDGLYVLPAGGAGSGARLLHMAELLRGGGTETLEIAAALPAESAAGKTAVANAARSAEEIAPQSLETIQDWLPDVNPGLAEDPLREENCGECALAVWRRLQGEETVADTKTYTTAQMENITGVPQVRMTPKEIADALRSKGRGAIAIVGVDRDAGAAGHWFNAYYDGNKVVSIDGQINRITDWPPDYDLPGAPVTMWDAGVL